MSRLALFQNLCRDMARSPDEYPLLRDAVLLEQAKAKAKAGQDVGLTLDEKRRLLVVHNCLATVYFVLAPDAGMVKIGKTSDLKKRLASLRTMSPVSLDLICVIRYDEYLERRIHDHFKPQRDHGEWFKYDDALREFIDGYNTMGLPWVVSQVGDAPRHWTNGRRGLSESLRIMASGEWDILESDLSVDTG